MNIDNINKYYNYNLNFLDKNLDNVLSKGKNVHLCCYKIDNTHQVPFIQYLLQKMPFLNILSFPQIDMTIFNFNSQSFIEFIKCYLFKLLRITDNELFLDNCKYQGFIEYKDEIFVFIDITECKIEGSECHDIDNLWFCLIDERY